MMTPVWPTDPQSVLRYAQTDAGKQDPHALFSHMRSLAPTWRDEDSGMLYLLNYADCMEAMRSPSFGAPDLLRSSPSFETSASLQFLSNSLSFLDPPHHSRIRSQIQRSFSVRVLDRSREHVQALVAERLASLRQRRSFDVVGDYAALIPSDVICTMLGVPSEDHEKFGGWLMQQFRLLAPTPPSEQLLLEVDAATAALVDYVGALIERRRAVPEADLISELVALQDTVAEPMSVREMTVTLAILLAGGSDTTKTAIALGTRLLLEHPDQASKLRADPALMRTAFEEIVRYGGAVVVANSRKANADTMLGDQAIAAGDFVVPVLAAANRDPARFGDPERFDITRHPNPHLGFGGGVHVCIGNMLARMVGGIAIPALIEAFPALTLASAERDVNTALPAMLGLLSLDVVNDGRVQRDAPVPQPAASHT